MLNRLNRQKRVLIVDDEATLVFFLKQGLQEDESLITVDGAASGEEALTKLTYSRYDLLITDLKMPGISGFTLVEVARSLHPQIGIILITAFGSPEVQNEADHLNVDGYLTKPFPIAQLQNLVNSILFRTTESTDNMITSQNNSVAGK